MLLPHGSIIALVDGTTCEIYRNAGSEAEPQLALLDPPMIDSTNNSNVGHRSSSGNHADRQVHEDAHARAVAAWLNEQVLSGRIKNLAILAPPRTLGELRRHYHSRTRHVLRKEVAKELAGFPVEAIMAALHNGS